MIDRPYCKKEFKVGLCHERCRHYACCKIIEAQQQEIENLNNNLAGVGQMVADYDTALQEIQQLQAKNAEVNKSLEYVKRVLKTLDNLGGLGYIKHEWIRKALEAIEGVEK
jgi:hypothetical protein